MAGERIYKASTIIIHNERGEVLLTKRKKDLKFLGGFHVYPGGKVDPEDYNITFVKKVPEQTVRNVAREWITNNYEEVAAHIVAGIREVFEEVGILLLKGPGLERCRSHKFANFRDKFSDLVIKHSLEFPREPKYIAHWITPPVFPVRFDTRFFLLELNCTPEVKPNPDEVEEYIWVEPHTAISLYESGRIKIMPPTYYTLKKLEKSR